MKLLSTALCLGLLSSAAAFAENDGAYLDAKYKDLKHPLKETHAGNKGLAANDAKSIIAFQSPVRSQGARGTCSIFSATAYIEGLLIKKGMNPTIDLSEEWLEYTAVRNKMSDGSGAWTNFGAIRDYGMPTEETLPYIGEDWTEVNNPLKDDRCGKLFGYFQKSCYIVHRDPNMLFYTDSQITALYGDKEFISARNEATDLKQKHIKFGSTSFSLSTVADVKSQLQKGMPVVLELDFFYGAWNHREADEFGIGRNMDHWSKGIVTFPEPGSLDETISPQHPAGHSVLVVGYDDNKIVEKTIKMANGSTKKFTYKGVYYFKNSWGTGSFGRDFVLDGQNFPGYGMIVAKYAEEIGEFFVMPLK